MTPKQRLALVAYKSALISLSFLLVHTIQARELRTPTILHRGPINELFLELKRDWCANFWFGEYWRSAKKAFNECGDTVNYAELYFGQSQFNAQQAFANSTAQTPTNPLLATSILGPRIKYKEQGTVLGLNFQGWATDTWRFGVRANLPLKKVRIKRLQSCGNGSSPLGGQTTTNLTQERVETVNGTPVRSFAYRLDFLSRLPYACTCLGLNYLIVNYRDPDFPFDNPVTISNQDISNENGTPVSVIKSANGTIPTGPFAISQQTAQQLPILSATGGIESSGRNIPNNGRARFDTSVNYLPLGADPAAQSTLFVVPSVSGNQVVAPARVIEEQVDELLDCISPTAEQVFTDCGISFAPVCLQGVGDFDTEIFAGHCFSPCVYGEIFFGMSWPTGKRVKNPLQVFKQPLGNNGHYESRVGLQGLWEPCRYAVLKADLAVSIVHKATERVAASFAGATVKNIGPTVPASIGWNYFTLHADVILTHPSKTTGIDIGYELYHKSSDHISILKSSTLDCLGNCNRLSSRPLSDHTEVTSHKIRAEFFYDFCLFKREGDFFIGGSHVVAGRNAPRETDFEFGFTFYF